jgi:hypothetical protein
VQKAEEPSSTSVERGACGGASTQKRLVLQKPDFPVPEALALQTSARFLPLWIGCWKRPQSKLNRDREEASLGNWRVRLREEN